MKALATLTALSPSVALAHPGHGAGTVWFFHDGPLIGVLALAALTYLGPELVRGLRRNRS